MVDVNQADMQLFISCFELIGIISFALSGAVTGLRKGMDLFGGCVLGLTTAVGGGIIRDLLLGITPPNAFQHPMNALVAIGVSIVVFIPFIRRRFAGNKRLNELFMLITDTAGLSIFTVCGVRVAIEAGFGDNVFLVSFVAVTTGVGGGVIRDVFAGTRPFIFVKHIYASAALAGSLLCIGLWNVAGENLSMLIGFGFIFVLRLLSARFQWSLPRYPDH